MIQINLHMCAHNRRQPYAGALELQSRIRPCAYYSESNAVLNQLHELEFVLTDRKHMCKTFSDVRCNPLSMKLQCHTQASHPVAIFCTVFWTSIAWRALLLREGYQWIRNQLCNREQSMEDRFERFGISYSYLRPDRYERMTISNIHHFYEELRSCFMIQLAAPKAKTCLLSNFAGLHPRSIIQWWG